MHASVSILIDHVTGEQPIDLLVFLKLLLHLRFEASTDFRLAKVNSLDMLILLECFHELFHLRAAHSVIAQIDMLNTREFSHELGQEVESFKTLAL